MDDAGGELVQRTADGGAFFIGEAPQFVQTIQQQDETQLGIGQQAARGKLVDLETLVAVEAGADERRQVAFAAVVGRGDEDG